MRKDILRYCFFMAPACCIAMCVKPDLPWLIVIITAATIFTEWVRDLD